MNILNLIHCLFLLLSQLLLIASGCVGDVECLPDQRSFLLDLKRGFNSTEILTTWLPNTNCCNWEGISCNSETGQVIGLDLSFHSFPGGNISSSLFKLTSLRTLNFACSSFSDDLLPIPQSGFEKLVDLTHLNLSNGLVGQIPIGISRLTRLTTLDLSMCNFEGGNAYLYNPNLTTLIRNLSNLRELYLDCVDISNDNNWSSAVSISLPRLQVLSLSGCNLQGLLNNDIFQLKNLMVLDLSGNLMLSGVMPKHFSKANTLKSLVLFGSNISGNLPVSIGNLKNLTRLDISGNMMAGTIPSSIGNLTKLVHLDLSGNNFRGMIPPTIGKVVQLENLDLSGNSLGGMIPSSVGNLTNLVTLYLMSTGISGEIPSSIGELSKLVDLDLSGNSLGGLLNNDIFQLKNLMVLDLSGNSMLSGVLPKHFSKANTLKSLVLSYTNMSGNLPVSIGNLKNLTRLDISGNMMAGTIPSSIGNLTKLVHLDLSGNNFRGMIPPTIGKVVQLEYLDLSYNTLGGMIPSSIGNLTNLVTLYLMSNAISGEIPSSIGKLPKLVDLDLSGNNLSSSFPPFVPWAKIQNLNLSRNNIGSSFPLSNYSVGYRHLSCLDLSFNSISGSIPADIFSLPALQQLILTNNQLSELGEVFSCPLTQLWYIDLSHNQLQGAIPMSLFKLSALQTLYIASNNFSGTVEMDMFESLKNLTVLDISNNELTIEDTNGYYNPSFPKFHELNFASCNLTKIPAFLRYQDMISTLDLSNNRISGDIPKWLWSVGNESLTLSLNLSCNLFTHLEGPTELSTIQQLDFLDLHSNKLQGPIPLPPKYIHYLDYSDNNFSSIIPSNIFSSGAINYSYISLANNRLTGDIPRSICGFLSVVDLSNNSLSGSIPSCFFELGVLNLRGNQLQGIIPQTNGECQLQTLILSDNNLEGQLPRSLINCSGLEVLDVGNNHIKDSFPFWLGNFVNLRVLILKQNEFYGPVELPENHEANYTFPKLQLFDLSANHFSGNLSSKYFSCLTLMMRNSKLNYSAAGLVFLNGSSTLYRDSITITIRGIKYALGAELSVFMSIDFSNNGFEGTIPDAIGELQGLHRLNLSNNALKGGIPSTIRNLKQLESLDLSGNHLSGLIPLELTSLTFLSFLNLSNNNLTGKIPQANQLSTFSNSSFLGNPGLCGSPLSKQCDSVNNRNDTRTTILKPDHSSRNYVIGLALFTGLGFGVGFAMAIVLQNVPLKSWIRKATAARN